MAKDVLASVLEAHKFTTTFEYPISQSIPHIYLSALAFSPLKSKIRQHYQGAGHALTVETEQPAQWTAPRLVLRGHIRLVSSVALSPNGNLVISGSDDNTVRIWDVTSGEAIGQPLRGHDDSVSSVAFSPDGKLVASGSKDKTVRLWDAASGEAIGQPLRGHNSWVSSVAFSPDGKLVVSGSDDKTVRIWDVRSGEPVGEPFRGHDNLVKSVAFSPRWKTSCFGLQRQNRPNLGRHLERSCWPATPRSL